MKLELSKGKLIETLNYCLWMRDRISNGRNITAIILNGAVIDYYIPAQLNSIKDNTNIAFKLNNKDYYLIAKVDNAFNDKFYAKDIKRVAYDLVAKLGHSIGTSFSDRFITVDDIIAKGSNDKHTFYIVKIDSFDIK